MDDEIEGAAAPFDVTRDALLWALWGQATGPKSEASRVTALKTIAEVQAWKGAEAAQSDYDADRVAAAIIAEAARLRAARDADSGPQRLTGL